MYLTTSYFNNLFNQSINLWKVKLWMWSSFYFLLPINHPSSIALFLGAVSLPTFFRCFPRSRFYEIVKSNYGGYYCFSPFFQILTLYEKLDCVNTDEIVRYIKSLQKPDGSFAGDEWGKIYFSYYWSFYQVYLFSLNVWMLSRLVLTNQNFRWNRYKVFVLRYRLPGAFGAFFVCWKSINT